MKIKEAISFLADAFFPKRCLVCGKEGEIVCQDCLSLIPVAENRHCPFCQNPKPVYGKYGKCLNHKSKKLDGLFCAADYGNEIIKKIISQFKYEPFLKPLAKPLSYLIISHIALSGSENFFKKQSQSVFVPIPSSSYRKRWRGFNQAEEIAKELSNFYGIALVNALNKKAMRKRQALLGRQNREKNAQGMFYVSHRLKLPFEGKIVFLVDDIFTTGATMEEAAKVLKANGAKEVWGIAVAREYYREK